MQKIIVTHLSIGGEEFTVPSGLSELLENAWVPQKTQILDAELEEKYNRIIAKNSKGRWTTRYERRCVSENQTT